ncbi:hypothetical protein GEMRC1_008863 [Eukaryota sp. GEM-RC1]
MSSISKYVPFDELDTSDEEEYLSQASLQKPSLDTRKTASQTATSPSFSKSRSPSVTDSRVWGSLKNSLVERARQMASLDIAQGSSLAEREASLLKRLETSDKIQHSLRDEIRHLKVQLETARLELQKKSLENEALAEVNQQHCSQLDDVHRKLLASEQNFRSLHGDLSSSTSKLGQLSHDNDVIKHDLKQKERLLREEVSRREAAEKRVEMLEREVAEMKAKYSVHDETVADLEQTISFLKHDKEELSNQLEFAEQSQNDLGRKVTTLEAQLQAAEDEVQLQSSKEFADLRTKRKISKLKDEISNAKSDCLRLMKLLSETPQYKFLKYELPPDEELEYTSDAPLRYLTCVLDNSLSYVPDGTPQKELRWFVPTDCVVIARRWAKRCLPYNSTDVLNNLLLALNAVWMSRMESRTMRLEEEKKQLKSSGMKHLKNLKKSKCSTARMNTAEVSFTLDQLETEIEDLARENEVLRSKIERSREVPGIPTASVLDHQSTDFFMGADWSFRLALSIFEKVYRQLIDGHSEIEKGEVMNSKSLYKKVSGILDQVVGHCHQALQDLKILSEDVHERCRE